MSLWKRTMDYLGLGPDDAYDDYDDYDEPEAQSRPSRGTRDVEARPSGASSAAASSCRCRSDRGSLWLCVP